MEAERWQQIEELYHAARDGNSGVLANADPELRREVEGLLAQGSGDGILDRPAANLVTESTPTMIAVGSCLGPYRIEALLGKGGMGEVYRARDPRLGRDVAIKVVLAHLYNDPQALARSQREFRAVAALSHPNILAIFDVGAHNGVTYAVTELLEGETLRARLRSGALPWQAAVEIGLMVTDGLYAAHGKGIIHRDLKPENIFLTTDGRAKILDFGLAKWHPSSPAGDRSSAPTETITGVVMGTPSYMSPEQVRGQDVHAPSDLFSLGCVLFEMVAGERAFVRETAAQTMTAIIAENPRPLGDIVRNIPPELEAVVMRCLEKSPEKRPTSAGEVNAVLKRIALDPEPPVRRRARRVRLQTLWVATAFLMLAAVAMYWFRGGAPAPQSLAVLPFVNTSGNVDLDYLSDGITESIINTLSHAPNLAVMSRNSVFRYKGQADAQAVGRALHADAILAGTVAQRGGGVLINAELIDVRSNRHLWGERYDRKLADLLTVQGEISKEISERLRLNLTNEQKTLLTKRTTTSADAYQLYLRGRFYWNKRTADGFNKSIEYFQKAIDVDPQYAPAYAAMAGAYENLANYNFSLLPPKQAWAKAKFAAENALQIDETVAEAHAALAVGSYFFEWNWPNAEREFRRSIELDPTSATTFHWYAHYLLSMRRATESLRAGQHAVELDPVDLPSNAHQGWYYLWTRQYDVSIDLLKKAIEMDTSFPIGQWYLGMAYEQKRAYREAIAQFQNCIRITAGRPAMVALLGHAYAAAKMDREARDVLEQLRSGSKQQYVPPYPIATIYAALGEKDQAFAWLEKAYQERDSWMDYLHLDPRLDNLHSDPRFGELVVRMNLPQ
jgi:serine/threonine protein kinase/tetratricopeptide (TPR) repeat protein